MMQTLLIVLVVLFIAFTSVMVMLVRYSGDLDQMEDEDEADISSGRSQTDDRDKR